MAVGILGILLLLLLLGGLVVLAGLLAYPRTRPFGLALIGVFGVVALLVFGSYFAFHSATVVPGVERSARVESMPQIVPEEWKYGSRAIIDLSESQNDIEEVEVASEPAEDGDESQADVTEELTADETAADSESAEAAAESSEEPAKVAAERETTTPDWIDLPPNTVGGVLRQVVSSGPWPDVKDCYRHVDQAIYATVQEFIREIAGEELRRPVAGAPSLEYLGVSMRWIREHLLCSDPEPFLQTSDSSVGPMKTLYVQLEVDRNDREYLRDRWREHARHDRIAAVAAGGTFLLGGIGLLFGLLKIDTWTKGYYTKRLFLGVPAAIIGIGTLLALMIS